jgi:hypothetical protein
MPSRGAAWRGEERRGLYSLSAVEEIEESAADTRCASLSMEPRTNEGATMPLEKRALTHLFSRTPIRAWTRIIREHNDLQLERKLFFFSVASKCDGASLRVSLARIIIKSGI